MHPTYGLFAQLFLLCLGFLWCREIFSRMRDDLQEIRQPDAIRRSVIVGLWVVTAVIVYLMAVNLLTILIRAAGAWRWPLF